MRVAAVFLQAALLAAAALGDFGSSPTLSRVIGASPAQAKNFYTRKRINGKWISGRFAKQRTVVKQRKAERSADRAGPGLLALAAPVLPASAGRPAADAVALRAGPLAPPPRGEHMLKLEEALKAHAHRLRTAAAAARGDESRPAANATGTNAMASTRPDARSVWLDFDSGVKTILFRDGSTIVEAFDVQALKALASARAADRR